MEEGRVTHTAGNKSLGTRLLEDGGGESNPYCRQQRPGNEATGGWRRGE